MSFSRQVSVFVKSLIGQSLEGVVFNPFQRKLGDTLLLPNGLKVALVGIADVVEKDEGIGVFHNTFYFLNEVTEGEPRRFLITMASKPDEQATHCCLLELVEARTYSDFVDGDQLDEVDDEYEYGGKTWKRQGKDRDGVETTMFKVEDPDGNGIVKRDEVYDSNVHMWTFTDGKNPIETTEVLRLIRCESGRMLRFWQGGTLALDSLNWEEQAATTA